jgi:chemotaxis protein methyltransferase CheR
MLMRHFRKEEAGWRISEAIRAMVQYREWNLLGDLRALGQFDVVFCRNVLIYFDQATKARVLDAVAQQMPADGLLYLGGAETVLGITSRFAPLAGERRVYGLAAASAAAQRGFADAPAGFDARGPRCSMHPAARGDRP